MEKKRPKMNITPLDDIFSTQDERDRAKLENIIPIPIKDIDNFPKHPFRVEIDDKILNSIKDLGVREPILVRPKENGRYELISGHRRKKASQMLKFETIPCIVKDLTDDEAIIAMVDCNYHREQILPSEKAFAYKMKYDAIKHQGERKDLTSCQVGTKLRTDEKIAENSEDSARQIQRYIRLTELIPELLTMVDNDTLNISPRMAKSPAEQISFLTKEEQKTLLDFMNCYDCSPNLAQAIKLKNHSQNKTLTVECIEELLGEQKANQKRKLKVTLERLILPEHLKDDQEREDYVVRAVNFYDKYLKKKRERERQER